MVRQLFLRFLAAHRTGEGGCADLLEHGQLNELKGRGLQAVKRKVPRVVPIWIPNPPRKLVFMAPRPVYWLDGAASPLQEHLKAASFSARHSAFHRTGALVSLPSASDP